nr:reverse transcriptase domain-containing protein [Tanacetum cinerariifolium]
SPIDTMTDQRTMAELLRAPTERYAEAIVVPLILAEQFELKHSLINMMTTDQFFGLEKENPQDHIPDQDSLNAAAGGNLLERCTQDVLTIIENKSKLFSNNFKQPHLQHPYKPLRKFVLLAVVLIHIISVSPPMATLSQNLGIISKDTFQQPHLITMRGRDLSLATPLLTQRVNSNPSPLEVVVFLMDLPFPLIPYSLIQSELKCKALADLGASINLMPLSVWKKLGLLELISILITLELANRAICTPAGIARDVFVSVGKFTFLANFVIVDYESDPRVPLILGRPFLQTDRALIDVHDDEFLEVESDTENVYDDPFDSKGEKIKESKLLIDELDLPCDFLPSSEYDSFPYEDFSRVDALPSTNNKDKDFDSPLYQPFFFKEVPGSNMLLLFSSENEEKVFKPGIHTSKKV